MRFCDGTKDRQQRLGGKMRVPDRHMLVPNELVGGSGSEAM
jgi:hypothetical protein